MSGWSDIGQCPKCDGNNLISWGDDKAHDSVGGECLDCGFYYYTKEGRMRLTEVNERRKDLGGMRPIKKLRKYIKGR